VLEPAVLKSAVPASAGPRSAGVSTATLPDWPWSAAALIAASLPAPSLAWPFGLTAGAASATSDAAAPTGAAAAALPLRPAEALVLAEVAAGVSDPAATAAGVCPAAEPPASLAAGPLGEDATSLIMLSCPDPSDSMASCSKGRAAPAPAGTSRLTEFPFPFTSLLFAALLFAALLFAALVFDAG
jgi:hypothetical protein